jgi:magnesium-transporting ATPase (P-type)
MMTGDKIETAINIAYNCGILEHHYHTIIFHHETEEQMAAQIEQEHLELANYKEGEKRAIVISGQCF